MKLALCSKMSNQRTGILFLFFYKDRLPAVQKFDVDMKDFVIHKDYSRVKREGRLGVVNDIGLIKLPKAAQFNQLTQPICLGPIPSRTVGEPVVVGWGKTDPDQLSLSENGVYSNDQLKLKVSLILSLSLDVYD